MPSATDAQTGANGEGGHNHEDHISPGGVDSAVAQAAWLSFRHALGRPAAIGVNADHRLATEVWRPIPPVDPDQLNETDLRKFRLGFGLFHEGRLSSADSVACISCHAGPQGAVDGLPLSRGVNRALGHFNSLSLFNADFHFRQFWDGRAVTLEDQALEPITNDVEMANTLEAVQSLLEEDALYSARFAAVYPDGVTLDNMTDALAYFQRINFTRTDSPFMRYLQGQPDQLSEQEQRGMQSFRERGCATCHNGLGMGGNSYQKLGALIPYYGVEREAGVHDEGSHRRSHRPHDMHVFKVPSLHTVAATAPYFHDGSVATLEAAIAEMAEHQLAVRLSDAEVDDIAAFLRALLPAPALLAVDTSLLQGLDAGVPPAADPSQHRDAYRTVLAEMEEIYARLLYELERLDSGQVAHFDFIQFQHRELIRRARALHFPPADLEMGRQIELMEHATILLERINELEWPLADLLRVNVMTQALALHEGSGAGEVLEIPQREQLESEYHAHSAAAREAILDFDMSGLLSGFRIFESM